MARVGPILAFPLIIYQSTLFPGICQASPFVNCGPHQCHPKVTHSSTQTLSQWSPPSGNMAASNTRTQQTPGEVRDANAPHRIPPPLTPKHTRRCAD
uniref:Putative secreted protein n=1 Tax=Anopheles darlingi TaxID=43151 RepID=A0A2M4DRD8_ANODA